MKDKGVVLRRDPDILDGPLSLWALVFRSKRS